MKRIKKTTFRLALTTSICALSLGLLSTPAAAAPGWSWNLSRDMLVGFPPNATPNPPANPINAWTFMESTLGGPSTLPKFGAPGSCWGWASSTMACWYNPNSGFMGSPIVGLSPTTTTVLSCPQIPQTRGVPILHPGMSQDAIVRWKNPLPQVLDVQVLGRFTHIDPCGSGIADGVAWSVLDHFGSTLAFGTLQSNMSATNETDVFSFVLTVNPNDDLFFVVNRVGNYYYDSTELDVLIVAQ